MALGKEEKNDIIKQFQKHPKDTGSVEVQIALLTKKINKLVAHLKTHKKDTTSKRGLLSMVGKRRALLNYLAKKNKESYKKLIEKLNLRK